MSTDAKKVLKEIKDWLADEARKDRNFAGHYHGLDFSDTARVHSIRANSLERVSLKISDLEAGE